ncbi:MAG: hypothetical protein ACM3NO_02225 [Deltaproteobacteria bacterium]
MFRISTIDTRSERRLVVEGTLTEPWVGELRKTWQETREDGNGRKVVIDLSSATVISREGERLIFELMQEGARFSCGGVLTKYVLKRLAHRCREMVQGVSRTESGCL